ATAPLHLDRGVHVPGRIDDVDAMIAPERRRRSCGDRDPALLLLGHPVHGGSAVVDLADLVDLLRVEEDPLGHGGLAGVDMRDDSDVPRACQRNLSCHGCCPSFRLYHLKWLKARLASAILWVSSRRLTAAPRPFMASTNSAASFSLMLLPFRLRAAWTSQRTPSDIRRSPRISTGTWYVAPPTRRGLTSMMGVALRMAASRISRPGRLACASARASASRRIRSDRFRLPSVMSSAVQRAVVRLTGVAWYFALRGMLMRRGMLGPPARAGRGLRAVLAPALPAIPDARRVQGPPDDVVLDRRQVLHPTTPDEDHRVLLEVVPDAGDVGGDL